jgi:hypothetical protein
MSVLIRQSVGQLKCEVVGHQILENEEDRLFDNQDPDGTIYTRCNRCGANLILKKSPKNQNEYYIIDS